MQTQAADDSISKASRMDSFLAAGCNPLADQPSVIYPIFMKSSSIQSGNQQNAVGEDNSFPSGQSLPGQLSKTGDVDGELVYRLKTSSNLPQTSGRESKGEGELPGEHEEHAHSPAPNNAQQRPPGRGWRPLSESDLDIESGKRPVKLHNGCVTVFHDNRTYEVEGEFAREIIHPDDVEDSDGTDTDSENIPTLPLFIMDKNTPPSPKSLKELMEFEMAHYKQRHPTPPLQTPKPKKKPAKLPVSAMQERSERPMRATANPDYHRDKWGLNAPTPKTEPKKVVRFEDQSASNATEQKDESSRKNTGMMSVKMGDGTSKKFVRRAEDVPGYYYNGTMDMIGPKKEQNGEEKYFVGKYLQKRIQEAGMADVRKDEDGDVKMEEDED